MRTLVYLIGTGPGGRVDHDRAGQRCLEAADVVIYDRTVHPRVLDLASRHAERIDVGRPAREHADQDAISFLLVEKAREGKIVARVKQGDPFIFDRGGEEALFLHEQGIPFEVVPGVPDQPGARPPTPASRSPTRAAATRSRSSAATRPATASGSKVAWAPLAKLDGTIVCYGGQADLRRVADELLAHGRAEDDSAALISRGTLASQEHARRHARPRWPRGSPAAASTAP